MSAADASAASGDIKAVMCPSYCSRSGSTPTVEPGICSSAAERMSVAMLGMTKLDQARLQEAGRTR